MKFEILFMNASIHTKRRNRTVFRFIFSYCFHSFDKETNKQDRKDRREKFTERKIERFNDIHSRKIF